MSSLDRKLAIGEMVSPADIDYDPEATEYPDPLEHPEAAVQKFFQEVNSCKRHKDLGPENLDEIDGFQSAMMDFLHTCSDANLGPEDLPGTRTIVDLFATNDNKNGISTFGSFQKEAIIPALIAAGATLAPKLMPYVGKGLQAVGLGQALQNVPIVGDMLGGGDGGGAAGAPIQTTDWDLKGPQPTYSNNRYEMPYQHVTDNLMFEAATSPGPKKRNEDIETLRAQVIAALKAWADSGEAENRAEWWVYFSYAHEASTIAELQTILTAVPSEYHNAVMTSPLPLGEVPNSGDSGLPDVTDPAEGSASIANQDAAPSPVPIDGAGTPQKLPQGQGLIPGAMASHDNLKIKPIFASVDESVFEDYAEEDRPVLAKVAKYLDAGAHEEQIVEELNPSFGLERTLWAIDQAKRVANNDPLVDLAVAKLGINWENSEDNLDVDNLLDEAWEETKNMPMSDFNIDENSSKYKYDAKESFLTMVAENEIFYEMHPESEEPPHDLTSLHEAYDEYISEYGQDTISQDELQDKIDSLKQHLQDDYEYSGPTTLSNSGANEDTKINQQADSNLITPQQEKWAYDYTAMPNAGVPSATNLNMPTTGMGAQNVGLPPNPLQLTEAQKQQQELMQLSQMYPNVPPQMAKNWLNSQKQQPQGHPTGLGNQPDIASSAGEIAAPSAAKLPSATTAKIAAWKDTQGNLLERGKIYKMTSPEYPIPDVIRVINNGPKKLQVRLSEAGIDLSLDEEKMRTSKYKFEPMKTASLEKEAYYLPGYHAIISTQNPETGDWHTEVAPNDRLGHIDVLFNQLLKNNKTVAKANNRMESGNIYSDYTVRGIYNPQTKHLVHLSHPHLPEKMNDSQKKELKDFWSQEMQNADLPLSGYNIYGEEESEGSVGAKDIEYSELPWEERQKAMRAIRRDNDPTRGHWLEDEPWQKGKTKQEIEYWNRAAKWKPINKTANLSTSQQRELIDEQGVARNLDRLNLEGTHYPELANFEQTATIEEETYELPLEDQDLFM